MRIQKDGVIDTIERMLLSLIRGPLNKSQLVRQTKVDSSTASRYMTLLLGLQLIAKSKDRPSCFIITQKGRDFLKRYRKLTQLTAKRH